MNTVLFDLDGTLLPMPDLELFLGTYFNALSVKFERLGKDSKQLMKAVWVGTKAMLDNDGTMTNERRFWKAFCSILGDEAMQLEPLFDDFYRNEFSDARQATLFHPHAKECIRVLKSKGYGVVLATNPLFPRVATHTRIEWAGLHPEDFEYITTYDNSSYCKPNPNYYREILKNIKRVPEECMMVGNDVKEDMCASTLGMDTFLLTDCLICSDETDFSRFQQGSFDELLHMICRLPEVK